MVMLNINIGKKETIFFMAFFAVTLGIGIVVAWGGNDPTMMGHSPGEIIMPEHSHLDFESGRVTQGSIILPIPGYTTNDCYLMVSNEDNHYGPEYLGTWHDSGSFGDNHYGGSQSFYTENIDNWAITCRYGMCWANNCAEPNWYPADCRYLQICEK